MTRLCRRTLALALAGLAMARGAAAAGPPRLVIDTDVGQIVAELYPDKAPATAGNFLAYADRGLLKGGTFYRVVRPDNDNNPAAITVIQGGLGPKDRPAPLPPISHETTRKTGLRHQDGVLSMARDAPGSATSEFFIVLGDQPALDFGGRRNPDGQGFAAFGRVVRGMNVVRAINAMATVQAGDDAYTKGQILARPVRILDVRRLR